MRVVTPLFALILLAATITSLFTSLFFVQAHICFTYPPQRGPTPSLHPGDSLCYNRVPDCGALPKGAPTGKFVQGVPTQIQLQQNLNHFYKPRPGYLDLAVSYDNEATWTTVSRIDDFAANNMDTQTFLSFPGVVFPRTGTAVLRGRYVSHNVNEVDPSNNTDAIFYSCSDIEVEATSGPNMATANNNGLLHRAHKRDVATASRAVASNNFKCTTPPRWIATGTEFAGQNPSLIHNIMYDSVRGWVKWERSNAKLGGTYDVTDLWNLTMASQGYTPQFVIGLKGKDTCSMFGGDRFFDWGFGPDFLQLNLRNETLANGDIIAVFENPTNGFWWRALVNAKDGTCLPVTISHGGNTFIEFDSQAVANIAPFNFDVPAYCKQGKNSAEDLVPDAGCKAHQRSLKTSQQ